MILLIFAYSQLFFQLFDIIGNILSETKFGRILWLKKIVAVDLDGTLLNGESKLSDFTKETIKKISKKGHHVVYRNWSPISYGQRFFMTNLNSRLLWLTSTVRSLTYLVGLGNMKNALLWTKKYLLDIVKRKEDIEADFIAGEYRKKFYITAPDKEIADPKLFGVENFRPENQFKCDLVTKGPNCILLQTRADDKYALAEEMNSFYKHQLNINTWGGPLNILECTPKGVHKAFALEYLLKVMNIDKQNLIAFGDEHNDQEMLSFAGRGYAMKNANPRSTFFRRRAITTNQRRRRSRSLFYKSSSFNKKLSLHTFW